MTDVVSKIKSRGYWSATIRPAVFSEDRVPFAELEELISSCVVRLRGWPLPFIDYDQRRTIRAANWVGQDVDAESVSHFEAWRFFTSGLFTQLRSFSADWRPDDAPKRNLQDYDSLIEVWEVLYSLTEIFELAARLALTPAGGESMVVDVSMEELGRRGLIVGQSNRLEFPRPYPAPQGELRRVARVSRESLVASSGDLAVSMALEIFERFGWSPAREQLIAHQAELTQGSF
jgi:hypothetical protein